MVADLERIKPRIFGKRLKGKHGDGSSQETGTGNRGDNGYPGAKPGQPEAQRPEAHLVDARGILSGNLVEKKTDMHIPDSL